MSELKTLKDIEIEPVVTEWICGKPIAHKDFIDKEELKAEAVKWVKEDIKDEEELTAYELTERWIKRLDVNRKDIKDFNEKIDKIFSEELK